MSVALSVIGSIAIGYFIGCLSPSYIVGKIKGYDPRSSGSGNAGASNTIIMAGKAFGIIVMAIDILKAAASCWIAKAVFPEFTLAPHIAGVSCTLGHMFPVFLGFRGGKGFACLGGCVIGIMPKAFPLMLAIAVVIAFVTNYVCISTCCMSAIWPAYYGAVTGLWTGAAILAVPLVPIVLKHMVNFRRIKEGREARFSFLWQRNKEIERLKAADASK